jgi:hypothetical protein
MHTDAVYRSRTNYFEKFSDWSSMQISCTHRFHNNSSLTRSHRSASSNIERLNTQTTRRDFYIMRSFYTFDANNAQRKSNDCVLILKYYDYITLLQLLYSVSHKCGTTENIAVFRQLSSNVHNIFTVHFDAKASSSLRKRLQLFVMWSHCMKLQSSLTYCVVCGSRFVGHAVPEKIICILLPNFRPFYAFIMTYLRSRKSELTAVGIRCADHATHTLSAKVDTNFADKRRSLGQYSSLVD